MSRSRRKSPITGLTTAQSEKQDKQQAHRRERHAIRQILQQDPLEETLPHWYDFSDPWSWAKDGKTTLWAKRDPKYLRK